MEETCRELPEECWESIIRLVGNDNHRHLEQLYYVSKTFLSFTNQVRLILRIVNPSIDSLLKQLSRFQNLKKVDLCDFRGVLHDALYAILESELNLEELDVSHKQNPCVTLLQQIGFKMKSLIVFKCSHSYLSDKDLIALSDSLISLQEIDISSQHSQNVTDLGIIALSKKLKFLQKINLTGNRIITDHSLISISNNCVFLTEIILRNCGCITQDGISYLIDNTPNYKSLIIASYVNSPLEYTIPFKSTHHLVNIELYYVRVSNEILDGIVKVNLPLKSFRLSFCTGFTQDGLFLFIKTYEFLEILGLDGTEFLTDEFVESLCYYTRNLTSINLDSCSKLTSSSFVTIALSCSRINKIEMSISCSPLQSFQHQNDLIIMNKNNPEIKSVSLTGTSRNIVDLLQLCPNLQVLKLANLAQLYDLDITYLLVHNKRLEHLSINHNVRLVFDWESDGDQGMCSKLQGLSLKKSRVVEDQLLETIAKMCPELVSVDLEGCMSVTERGVRVFVENCRKLRYVNLDWCTKVKKDVVAWMMDTSYSLKEIVVPFPMFSIEHNNKCLLTQGSSGYQGHPFQGDSILDSTSFM